MASESFQRLVCSGRWLYDGSVWRPVHIIEQNYDFWHELAVADGKADPDELPTLNANGLVFYVLFEDPGERPWWPRGEGFPTIEVAKVWAGQQLPVLVEWLT